MLFSGGLSPEVYFVVHYFFTVFAARLSVVYFEYQFILIVVFNVNSIDKFRDIF